MGVLKVNTGLQQVSHPARRLLDRAIAQRSFPPLRQFESWIVVFNIGGNKYRLIAAVHYNTQIVYALLFLTHAEYDKDKWKKVL